MNPFPPIKPINFVYQFRYSYACKQKKMKIESFDARSLSSKPSKTLQNSST